MPAKDTYHDTVVHALEKAGWIVESEQYLLVIENRVLWVDLQMTNLVQQRTILVEVKSFLSSSQVDDMANATGKYVMYSAILEDNEINNPLYLAIPQNAYEGIFSERLGEILSRKLNFSLIVFDPDTEEVAEWIG